MDSAAHRVDDQPTLERVDYTCAFERAVFGAAAGRDAEAWARATWEGAPAVVRWLLVAGWRFGLGFRLGPTGTPDDVLGVPVVHREPHRLVVELRSRLLVAHNVFTVRGGRVHWATLVRYEAPGARALWAGAALLHRVLAPWLLNRAGRVRHGSPVVRAVLRAMPVFNAPLAALLRAGRFGRRFTVVGYTGRRTGRAISTPVSYVRTGASGATVRIGVAGPQHKTWWRNFDGEGAPLTLTMDGAARPGHGVVERGARGRITVVVTLGER